jgi:hypothetical protein
MRLMSGEFYAKLKCSWEFPTLRLRKILRYLHERLRPKVAAKEESEDLDFMKV